MCEGGSGYTLSRERLGSAELCSCAVLVSHLPRFSTGEESYERKGVCSHTVDLGCCSFNCLGRSVL